MVCFHRNLLELWQLVEREWCVALQLLGCPEKFLQFCKFFDSQRRHDDREGGKVAFKNLFFIFDDQRNSKEEDVRKVMLCWLVRDLVPQL